MAILPGSLLIDRALAGEKFLEVATYTEEGVLHIIGGAVRVANDSARSVPRLTGTDPGGA